jgi:mRNA interferase RelE/StbE
LASKVEYKSSVAKDLRRLDRKEAKRVLRELEAALRADPDSGEPLKGRFGGLLKLRIGDYRVIYARTEDGVLVLRIGHRRSVYR